MCAGDRPFGAGPWRSDGAFCDTLSPIVTPLVDESGLLLVMEEARRLGFLGPGPVVDHIDHAHRYLAPLDAVAAESAGGPLRFVDLGAGGGLPSLPLLAARAGWQAVLMDAAQKRCSFLVWALAELDLADRAEVWNGRVELLAHQDRARFVFDAAVARSFGPPAVVAECGAALIVVGGKLVISEPPGGREWPAGPLAHLGLRQRVEDDHRGVVVLERVAELPDPFPRPAKEMQRSPLW